MIIMPRKFKETKCRTIVKTIILRIIVFSVITFFVVIMGNSILEGIEIALLDIGIELVTYYFYERLWMKINWGIVEKELDDPAKTYNVIIPPIIEEEPEEKIELEIQGNV